MLQIKKAEADSCRDYKVKHIYKDDVHIHNLQKQVKSYHILSLFMIINKAEMLEREFK